MTAVATRKLLSRMATAVAVLAVTAVVSLPALAQENSPDVTDQPVGTLFRWLNFLLVFGVLAYFAGKLGGPYFRGRANEIAESIEDAAKSRAEAEREFQEASQRLANVDSEIEQEKRAGERDSAADHERIRALTRTDIEKIVQAARAEIAAAERQGTQELRAIAARLATERAAGLIRQQLNAAAETALFEAFVGELERVQS